MEFSSGMKGTIPKPRKWAQTRPENRSRERLVESVSALHDLSHVAECGVWAFPLLLVV